MVEPSSVNRVPTDSAPLAKNERVSRVELNCGLIVWISAPLGCV